VSGSSGERPTYAGTDFIIARDGKIAAVYLFLTIFLEYRATTSLPPCAAGLDELRRNRW
jgi:hypothetical protein